MPRTPSLQEWAGLVAEHLDFLRSRGFELVPLADEAEFAAAWGPRIRYVGATMGLQLHWSVEYDCVDTDVIKLIDGRVPDYPIFVHDGDPIYWFALGPLLAILASDRADQARALTGLALAKVHEQLAFVAEVMQDLGDELLDPTSPVFGQRTAQLHEQARADPPKITVYVPEGTSPERAEQIVEETKAHDPRVGVLVRRYFNRMRRGRP